MGRRNRALEHALLDRAETHDEQAATGWALRVMQRLETVGAKHGDRWASAQTRDLLFELAEEALDLGGWAVLALQRASTDPLVPDDALEELGELLEQIAAQGARTDRLIRQALDVSRYHTASVNP